tara:strand:- start:4858 stop:6450 length:1593 start_codon:yes stop_codon:yes gene_type:complete
MAKRTLKKSQIKEEIIKCGKDPVYFINNYAKIVHPLKGLISFKTYPFQTQLLQDFNNYRFNVILKARQLGISTISAAYVLWLMMFYREKNVLVIATKFGTAANLVKKVKNIMKNLPDWLRLASIAIDNRASFELSNGSQIKASSTSADAGRSEALSLLVVDEAAHIENMSELWAGLYPTISTGGRVIALSSPYGVGNWFHKVCEGADQGTNDFHLTTLPWSVHPEHDDEWFEKETKNMSKREIAQEFLCNFNASGETVIHPEDIERVAQTTKEPNYRTGFDRNYWIWEEPDPSAEYLLSADVARGDGKDYSVFHVLRLDNLDVVAEYKGKPSIDMYADFLNSVGREYGNCMLVIENNSVGFSVLEKLIDLEYPNLYYSIKSSHSYISPNAALGNTNAVAGFTTSQKTRPLIIAKLEEFIRNKLINLYSKRLVEEMRTFVWNNGRPEAMRSCNDDLIMALAIACWVRDTALVKSSRDVAYKKAMLDSIGSSKVTLNTTIPGMADHRKSHEMFEKKREAKKQNQEFMWLYKG